MMLTRRQLILGLLGTWLAPRLAGFKTRRAWAGPAAGFPRVLDADRQRALAAAAERILPGALRAGFTDYMNYWLARQPYESAADWKPLLNIGAVHLDRLARREHQRAFSDCKPEQQDRLLERFQKGEIRAKRFRSDAFFKRLVMLTLESFLSDPVYGGNKNGVGFRFIGRSPCWWAPGKIRRPGPAAGKE